MSRSKINADVTEIIGNTPLVYINNITKGLEAKIAVKIEYMNPSCSVKDRPAKQMIVDAEAAGLITPGVTTLIECTSGNMGIGMAHICAVKNYKLILVMSASMSLERRTACKAYGADIVLTDPALGVEAALKRVDDLCQIIPNSFVLGQFTNKSNPRAHYLTTGPEIWEQTEHKVDVVVFGIGSAGTISGVGKFLKERNPKIKAFGVEPWESSVLNGFKHSPHKIQGTGAGFEPENLDRQVMDACLRVHSDDAIDMAKRLAREEGLLVGISSGANLCGAIQLAKMPEFKGKLIVTSFASFGDRYLSTVLYSDISEECEKMKQTTIEEDNKYFSKKYNF
uniref:Cysteine synthase n=1 Tax=Rhabditophanes sp. KR3021 TaxID=114890 RepID=A0AC35TX62_9BILA